MCSYWQSGVLCTPGLAILRVCIFYGFSAPANTCLYSSPVCKGLASIWKHDRWIRVLKSEKDGEKLACTKRRWRWGSQRRTACHWPSTKTIPNTETDLKMVSNVLLQLCLAALIALIAKPQISHLTKKHPQNNPSCWLSFWSLNWIRTHLYKLWIFGINAAKSKTPNQFGWLRRI